MGSNPKHHSKHECLSDLVVLIRTVLLFMHDGGDALLTSSDALKVKNAQTNGALTVTAPGTCPPPALTYSRKDDGSKECWPVERQTRYYVTEWGRLQGGEEAMMSEIFSRGPIGCGAICYLPPFHAYRLSWGSPWWNDEAPDFLPNWSRQQEPLSCADRTESLRHPMMVRAASSLDGEEIARMFLEWETTVPPHRLNPNRPFKFSLKRLSIPTNRSALLSDEAFDFGYEGGVHTLKADGNITDINHDVEVRNVGNRLP